MLITSSSQRNPLIGWHNVVTPTNISADSSAAGYPASNMANPAVNLLWRSAVATQQRVIVVPPQTQVSYLAFAAHNLATVQSGIQATAYQAPPPSTRMMLHFNGITGTTVFTDEVGNVWTANGNAQLNNSLQRFGVSAGLFDGAGDWISTPDSGNFTLGAGDWTLEFWFYLTDLGGASRYFCGQINSTGTSSTASLYVERNAANQIAATAMVGSTGSTAVTAATYHASSNVGWHHLAFVRQGSTVKLFIDGVQDGSAAITGSVNDSANQWAIGRPGEINNFFMQGVMDEFRLTVGQALYTANFARPTAPFEMSVADVFPVRNEAEEILLWMDNTWGPTNFKDEGRYERLWSTQGNAVIQNNVGGVPAGYFDGVGDYITAAAFLALGTAPFTFDTWFYLDPTDVGGVYRELAGQCDASVTPTSVSFLIERNAAGFMRGVVYVGSTEFAVSSPTPYNGQQTPGWHHLAFSRSGNTLLLFIDGVLVATAPVSGSVNASVNNISVGRAGEFASGEWKGWIDNFRFIRDTVRWTGNFTPPSRTAMSRVPSTNGPIIMQFAPAVYSRVTLQLLPGSAAPEIGVMYAGLALELERSLDVNVGHVVIDHGRQSRVAIGKAESGKHIGRIVLGEWRESVADFKWFTPAWYRANFDPFLAAAMENPFFFAWNPVDYPAEVGFVSLLDDPDPTTDPVTQRVAVALKMSGEA
jgi:hypothetical protein